MKKKHGKTKVGKFLTKVGKGVKKIAKEAGKIAFAPLLPFKLAMKQVLKEKGVNADEMKMNELVQTFHSVIIEKKGNYEIQNYEHLGDDVIASVISGIIAYFKNLKKRKEAGEKLTPAEEKALKTAEDTTGQAIEDIKEEGKQELMSKSYIPIIIIAVIAVILLFTFLKKKK
jgi:hypothetical protein